MQHIRRGDFAGEVNFELFHVLDLFLRFETTPCLSKLIKAFQICI